LRSAGLNLRKSYDLTLILPPLWDVTRPWTATVYLCEYMRSLGYRVQFIDFNIELYHWCKSFDCGDLWHNWRYFEVWSDGRLNFLARLMDLNEIRGEVAGFSVGSTSLAFTTALAGEVRKRFPRKKIIWGGHGVFLPSEVALIPMTHAGAICKGEDERAEAMAAARSCVKRMRNRRIARGLDHFGLLTPVMQVRNALRRSTQWTA